MALPAVLTEKHLGLPTWGWLTAGGVLLAYLWWRNRQTPAATTAGTLPGTNAAPGTNTPSDQPPTAAPPTLPPIVPPAAPPVSSNPCGSGLVPSIFGCIDPGNLMQALRQAGYNPQPVLEPGGYYGGTPNAIGQAMSPNGRLSSALSGQSAATGTA